jgi:hypothetical protein
MNLIGILEACRRDFLDAVREVYPAQALARPAIGSWSVLECIEHVVALEEHYLAWIEDGTAAAPQRDAAKETRLFMMIRSRLEKAEAPEPLRPRGRFASLPAAVAEFNAVRDRSVRTVQELGEGLYAVGVRHPYFGDVNGVELIHLIDGHTRRHADQIREICEVF